jgi:hypothetical protein
MMEWWSDGLRSNIPIFQRSNISSLCSWFVFVLVWIPGHVSRTRSDKCALRIWTFFNALVLYHMRVRVDAVRFYISR